MGLRLICVNGGHWVGKVSAAALFLPLVGCGQAAGPDASDVTEVSTGNTARTVEVLVAAPAAGGMEALGGGELQNVGGCLGADGSVIVWPHGTQVLEQDPLLVDIPGYGSFGIGGRVRVGGGYVLEHSSDDVEPGPFEIAGSIVPASCARFDIFVANAGE